MQPKDPVVFCQSDSVFTVEHVLEILQLSVNYGREYKRKDRLLRQFFAGDESDNAFARGSYDVGTDYGLSDSIEMKSNGGVIDTATAVLERFDAATTAVQWPDNSAASYIDHTLGNIQLLLL